MEFAREILLVRLRREHPEPAVIEPCSQAC